MYQFNALQEEERKKTLLMERLNGKLNSSVHTQVDLSLREISSEQGGLCGLAAIYQALDSTLLTKSQLRAMGYEDLVEVMASSTDYDELTYVWDQWRKASGNKYRWEVVVVVVGQV